MSAADDMPPPCAVDRGEEPDGQTLQRRLRGTEILAVLASCRWFRRLDETGLRHVLQEGTLVTLPKNRMLFRTGDHPFWLDSSSPGGELGQLSVMGDASGPLARTARADVHAGTVTVTAAGTSSTVESTFLTWLENDLAGLRTEVPRLPFEFALGWVEAWRSRLALEARPGPSLVFALRRANPAFIARNHRVEEAIAAAIRRRDFEPFETLVEVLARPFDDQPERAYLGEPPRPEERVRRTFCGT